MQIFVINLDRHAERGRRMQGLLQSLDFKRIAAMDGRTIDGTEWRDPSRPMSYETLSRYERACILSHRIAVGEFLAGKDPYCCVLEDDIYISPDFPRFIKDEAWIPKDSGIVKIESCQPGLYISRKTIRCLDRKAAMPRSLNFGCAAYIISRRIAKVFMEETLHPNRTIDRIMFDELGLTRLCPVYQLLPALCIQANQRKESVAFPELASSVQPTFETAAQPQIVSPRKTLANKIKRELVRPIHQLIKSTQPVQQAVNDRIKGVRYCNVPFA